MKRLFIVILLLLFVTSVIYAKRSVIHLYYQEKGEPVKNPWGNSEERIPAYVFFLTYENDTLYVYANKNMEHIQISISNKNGDVVFFTVSSLVQEEEATFPIKDLPKGEYCIELLSDTDYYYGYFEIAQ